MAFSLKDIFFSERFWTHTDITTDPNKDGSDKGTLQRYNEILGGDYDIELQPLIEGLVANNVDPDTILSKFLVYLESTLLPVSLGTADDMRRRVLKYTSHFNRIKGTFAGYEIMFSMLTMDTVIVETWDSWTWDDPIKDLDDPDRKFDSNCAGCSPYCVVLSNVGPPIVVTQQLLEAIFNIIEYNEPINARLQKVTLNGACIVQQILSVLVLSNGDLTYNNQYTPGTFLALKKGDIYVSGNDASKYSLSPDGDLLYTC